jgi:hypothetical protein
VPTAVARRLARSKLPNCGGRIDRRCETASVDRPPQFPKGGILKQACAKSRPFVGRERLRLGENRKRRLGRALDCRSEDYREVKVVWCFRSRTVLGIGCRHSGPWRIRPNHEAGERVLVEPHGGLSDLNTIRVGIRQLPGRLGVLAEPLLPLDGPDKALAACGPPRRSTRGAGTLRRFATLEDTARRFLLRSNSLRRSRGPGGCPTWRSTNGADRQSNGRQVSRPDSDSQQDRPILPWPTIPRAAWPRGPDRPIPGCA